MRILLLGGTSFVGRAIVEQVLRDGADVTLFTRGRTGTALFPGVPRLVGDRDAAGYTALRTQATWDAVVDCTAYVPRHVDQAMDTLGDRVGRYLLISSHAVYQVAGTGPGSTEDTPRVAPVREAPESGDAYGGLKAACEDDVTARYGERATIVRPGKIVGPHDVMDTLAYYARRAARGGRMALPGDPQQPVQFIDVRDLAALVARLITDGRPGTFTAVGPEPPTTLGGLIRTCAEVAGTDVEVVRVPPGPPLSFPFVRPVSVWNTYQRSPARARAVGMPATPLAQTVADVRAWDRDRGEPPLAEGYSAEQEAAALAAAEHS